MDSPASPSPLPTMQDVTSTPPYRKTPTISPSPLHLSNYTSIPIRELLSPSPKRRPRSSRAQIHDENHDPVVIITPKKKRRGRAAAMVVAAASGFPGGCVNASPRVSVRRARRRLEKEVVVVRDEKEREKENGEDDGVVKGRKKRPCRAKKVDPVDAPIQKEDLSLVPYVAPSKDDSKVQDAGTSNEQTKCNSSICDSIYELIMWTNTAKSTLWFGFGSMFFLSTSFSRDFNFSIITYICHIGVLILGLAFIRDSIPQQQEVKSSMKLQLTEEDILRVSKILLPIFNAAISKSQMVFCGDPSTTLKVLPVLLFGAKYGHLITLWRLFITGFFISFTMPKLFSCYSQPIHRIVENVRDYAIESWRNCPRKKFVAATIFTMFWNLFSVKTRIIAGFVSLVVLRYHKEQRNIEEEANHEAVEMETTN